MNPFITHARSFEVTYNHPLMSDLFEEKHKEKIAKLPKTIRLKNGQTVYLK